jgi:hypothetical protein
MYHSKSLLILMFSMLLIASVKLNGQSAMPVELTKGPIKEQLRYLEEKTRIYENYRAIREDMFQKLKINVSDTLSGTNLTIAGLKLKTTVLNHKIDSLSNVLNTTKASLEEITRTKNSIRVFGMEVNKSAYNTTMWTIVAILLAMLAIGFLVFKRNLFVTSSTKKELQEMKNEFEAYRKTTREAREKASMAHFLELKKLRGE